MPWGTDDGGHYYISPVEKRVISDDLEERRINKVRTATQVYKQKDSRKSTADIMKQFCKVAIMICDKQEEQRKWHPEGRQSKEIGTQIRRYKAIYKVLLTQLKERGVADG